MTPKEKAEPIIATLQAEFEKAKQETKAQELIAEGFCNFSESLKATKHKLKKELSDSKKELEKAKELLRECQERFETILVIGVERDEVNVLIRKLNTESV